MKVRAPKFAFEEVFPHWAPNREFAQANNAVSITPCTLEPFMIKAFRRARERLDPARDAQLIREVDWFIGQEAQHFRAHNRFNRCFKTDAYPAIAGIEQAMADDLEDYLANRPLEFCLAYAEGFEAMGAVYYKLWFEELGRFREGAKEEAIALFDWHYAEEFEHREVAFKLYKAIAARGSLWRRAYYGYVYRIKGVLTASAHIGKYTKLARDHLMERDRAGMTEEEQEASRRREKAFLTFLGKRMARGLIGVLSPFYDPANKRPPRGLDEVLAQFEPGARYGPARA